MLQRAGVSPVLTKGEGSSTEEQLRLRESRLENLGSSVSYLGEIRLWGDFNYFYVGQLPRDECDVEIVPEQVNGNGKPYLGRVVYSESGLNRFYVGSVPRRKGPVRMVVR